ncbi:zinc-dependent alcohol dehydrogenase family protein [Mycobacterium sp. NPDC048908]|uniref:zinc-dependent alcohol dehydrogenase family protein n=1 Tax=Mycobacterium sp. NPDC048908 TaxID=3364292 RepID=UPI0037139D2F
MKAAVLIQFGAPLQIVEMDVPSPGPGQVLVRVIASGVNPLDTKIRHGQAPHARTVLPAVLGMDMAGVVESVGDGVDEFRPGDDVFGMTGGVGGIQGTLAEFVAVDHRLLAPKPHALSMQEAAALPLAFITAREAFVGHAHIRDDALVLVHGGAGSGGQMAIQLARHRGAKVFATGSPASQAIITAAGAVAIDYTTTTVAEYVDEHSAGHGFDVVFDTVGGATLDDSFAAVKRYTGHVVSALGWGTHSLAPLSFRAATYSGVFTLLPLLTGLHRERHGRALRLAAEMADSGQLGTRLDGGTYTLANLEEAYAVVEKRTATGKVIVQIAQVPGGIKSRKQI